MKRTKQFITLDKSEGAMCEYITGERPWKSPLEHVHVFEEMQKMMVRYCNQRMVDSDNKLEALRTKEDEEGWTDNNMQRVVGNTLKATAKAARKRPRSKRYLFALPAIGPVDLPQDGIQWHPMCLVRPGTKNVAMEATTENFAKLFEIVSKQLDASTALLNAWGAYTWA